MQGLTRPLVLFDLETTDLDPDSARIVEVAMVKVNVDESLEVFETVVNPQVPIPAIARNIHGITDEMVKQCPTFGQIAERVFGLVEGQDLAGYNILGYDWPLLLNEFGRVRAEPPRPACLVDALPIFRQEYTEPPHTLARAWEFYCPGKPMAKSHRALADVRTTYGVLRAQKNRRQNWNGWESAMREVVDQYADSRCLILKNNLTVTFGKVAGMPLARVFRENRQHYKWLRRTFPACDQHLFLQIEGGLF